MIAPGSTIGILGGGQLGRMLILAGRTLGYRFHVFDPSAEAPASGLADKTFTADYNDQAALSQFADAVDVITLEFENIPIADHAQMSILAETIFNFHALASTRACSKLWVIRLQTMHKY